MPGILQERIAQKEETHSNDILNKAKKPSVESQRHYEHYETEENKTETLDNLTEEDIFQLDQLDKMMSEENFVCEKRRKKMFRRISMIFLTVACSYLVVLIYGSFITEFLLQ